MSQSQASDANGVVGLTPSGPGAAAILAAGIGSATLGVLAFAGDASPAIKTMLNFYDPVGALSGVTTVTIVVWVMTWFALFGFWRTKTITLWPVNLAAFALLCVGFLLTFPPVMDLLQGK